MKIEIPDGVQACVVITYGDTDHDGKSGVRAMVFGDFPDILDGTPGLESLDWINKRIPEFDSVPPHKVTAKMRDLFGHIEPVFEFLVRMVK